MLPFFHGSIIADSRKEEFDRYNCGQLYHAASRENIPEICKKYYNSIGFYVYNGAFGKEIQ